MPISTSTEQEPPQGSEPQTPAGSPASLPEQQIDLRALAEKVYDLLVKELRVERERR